MAEPEPTPPSRDAIVPPSWRPFYEATHIPAAVRVENRIYLTGHTGDLEDGTSPRTRRARYGAPSRTSPTPSPRRAPRGPMWSRSTRTTLGIGPTPMWSSK
jgi:hypothetical protein